jgi:hypothetical protein
MALGGVGLYTAAFGTLVGNTRSDRKGALAYSTSATIGLIFCTLALGYTDTALMMSLGHTAFRMNQVMQASNIISNTHRIKTGLGHPPWPYYVSDKLYRLAWGLRRLDTDVHLVSALDRVSRLVPVRVDWRPATKLQQWALTGTGIVLAGAPFTPLAHGMEGIIIDLLHTNPALAGMIMAGHFTLSVVITRLLLTHVVRAHRLRKDPHQPPTSLHPKPKAENIVHRKN